MANKNTKRNRMYHGYKKHTGICVNSTLLRQEAGKRRYDAPTRGKHSGSKHSGQG